MKFYAALALFGFAFVVASAIPQHYEVHNARNLEEDFEDFGELLPTSEVLSLLLEYALGDDEFQKVISYAFSEDFKELVQDVDAIPEYIQVSHFYYYYLEIH